MITDRQLLIRAAGGEEAAFAELYHRYESRLAAFFRKQGADAGAMDLTQQTFLQLLESDAFAKPKRGPDDLSALLFTIARNLLKNQFRYQQRKQSREAIFIERSDEGGGSEPRLDPDQLAYLIDSLPGDHREVIHLRFRRGLSVREIAGRTDCPEGTVKSRIHYAVKMMRTIIRDG